MLYVMFIVGFVFGVLLYKAAKEQFKKQDDLELNDRNEIVKGTVEPRYRPIINRPRKQPTWMN